MLLSLLKNNSFMKSILPVVPIANPLNQSLSLFRNFSKYISKSRAKRLPMTTKRAGKGFYKGNRTRKEGFLNSKGEGLS